MREDLIVRFDRPGEAYAARRELRALQKELRLGRLPSIAVVTKPARDSVQFDQDGDVGVGGGARFGLVVGALLGAVLLAPFVGVLVAGAAGGGLATAPSADDWVVALALVVAVASGLTALLAALGGALLGGSAAALINFGMGSRDLAAIGDALDVGEAALVLRVTAAQRPPLVAALALSGGTPVRHITVGQDDGRSEDDAVAASFAAQAYQGAGAAFVQRLEPVALAAPPVDPRQRDLVVAECADAGHVRRAVRSLRRLRRSLGGLAAGNRAIVTRDDAGRARIRQAENVTAGRGALVGGLAGAAAGMLVGGLFGVAIAALSLMLSQGVADVPSNAGGFLVAFGLVFGAVGALIFGLGGGVLGAGVAHVVNLAYDDADLRLIAETVPPGKALLIASLYHHGGPAAVSALRAEGATIRQMPLPAEQLVDATIDAAPCSAPLRLRNPIRSG